MSGSNIQGFRFNEEPLSQIPALQELIALGYDISHPSKHWRCAVVKTAMCCWKACCVSN